MPYEAFRKSRMFTETTYPNFPFLVQIWPQFTPWRVRNKKNQIFSRKKFSHWAIYISQNKGYLVSIFNENHNYFLHYLDIFQIKMDPSKVWFRASCWWKIFGHSLFQTSVIMALMSVFTCSDIKFPDAEFYAETTEKKIH